MRVFCVFVFICALTWASAPAPATTTTKAPDPTTTTTEAPTPPPTTPTPKDKSGNDILEFLEGSVVSDSDSKYDCQNSGSEFVNPTPKQKKAACISRRENEIPDGFVYIKDKNDQTIHCCIRVDKVCMGKEKVAFVGSELKKCNDEFECGVNYVCHEKIDHPIYAAEKQRLIAAYGGSSANIGDICCPAEVEAKGCQAGNLIKTLASTNTVCQNNYGRCEDNGKYGVCSRADVAPNYNAACCELTDPKDLCPGGLLPISLFILQDDNSQQKEFASAYDFRFSEVPFDTVRSALELKCNSMKKDGLSVAYVYQRSQTVDKDKLCCPYGIQADNTYVSGLTGVEQISNTPCKDTTTCADASKVCSPVKDIFNNLNGSGKLCFDKPSCPNVEAKFTTKNSKGSGAECNVANSGECVKDSVCVRSNSNLGICCENKAYNDLCKKEKSGVHEVEKDGQVVDIAESKCITDTKSTDTVRGVVNVSNHTTVCCEWKARKGNVCKNKGKYVPDPRTKNPLKCSATAKEGDGCEGKTGVCRKQGTSSLYCCDENLCPTDRMTPLGKLPECEKSACKDFSPNYKKTYCVEDKNDKNTKKCCPATAVKNATGSYGMNPAVTANKIRNYKLEGTTCKATDDCGGFGKYCDDGACWNYGSNTLFKLESKCENNDDCKASSSEKITYICIKMGPIGDKGTCAHHKKVVAAKKTAIKLGYIIGAVVNAILAILFGLIAVVMFLKYRSKNFCDSRKPSKSDKKKKKESKTEVSGATSVATGTTGGTSTAQ